MFMRFRALWQIGEMDEVPSPKTTRVVADFTKAACFRIFCLPPPQQKCVWGA